MRIFDVSFAGGTERTSCIRSFRFDCAEKIDFLPGQFLKLIFDEAAPDNGRFKVHYVVTESRPPEDGCFYGRIDRAFIEGRDPLFKDRTVFIFGSPAMVTEMRGVCSQIRCLGSNIKNEGFTGY